MLLRSLSIALFALFLLINPSSAEEGAFQVIGTSKDMLGSEATVGTVNLGRDKYLAVSIKNQGLPDGATHIILKNEVSRLLKMCQKGASNQQKLKKGVFKILDNLAGDQESLAVVRANPEGQVSMTILQITQHGRERNFVLTPKSWSGLKANIKKASRQL